MDIFLYTFLYIIIGTCWMIFHAEYLFERKTSLETFDRPEGGPLYPAFMILLWPLGMIVYGITKIFKL
tara:strand:- start:4426 stop:4629 length:204 start_codon:yes stop_codon:yes gene_type:complete